MIIELFYLFAALSIVAIWLGYYTGDEFHTFVGLFVLFYIFLMLSQNQVFNSTTSTENATFSVVNGTQTGEVRVISKNYTVIDDTTTDMLSRMLMFAAGFGMVLRLYLMRKERRAKDD